MKWFQKIVNIIKRNDNRASLPLLHSNIIQEWNVSIEVLIPLIRAARRDIDPINLNRDDFDEFDVFEANSTLYQAERLVLKIREYILALNYYQLKFYKKSEIMNDFHFVDARRIGLECYHTIVRLVLLFQEKSSELKISNYFISHVQTLEMQCASLRQAIWKLNQLIVEYDLKYQFHHVDNICISQNYTENLKRQAREVPDEQDHFFLLSIVSAYDTLKKCYVVSRNDQVKQTLDNLYVNIEILIYAFSKSQVDKKAVFSCLYVIFNQIESLRFSANRENRVLKPMFEKARYIRHQLRKSCYKHPMAKEFLDEITFRRWVPSQSRVSKR